MESGLIDELEAVQIIYRRDHSEEFRKMLRRMSVEAAMALAGLVRRQVLGLRAGRGQLHPEQLLVVGTGRASRRL